MRTYTKGAKLRIGPEVYILAAAMVLLVPLKWLCGWLFATAVHELFHYLMLRACKVDVYSVSIGGRGMLMHTAPMSNTAELLCAAAGPIGGFSLLLASKWYPSAAICGYIQSVYNLIPLGESDGGRVLRCVLSAVFPEKRVERIICWTEVTVTLVLAFLGFYCCIALNLGLVPAGVSILLLFRCLKIKISCKEGKLRVQYTKRK